ncbi:MAG: class B sortase [Oscillospiraceae bacterium]|nr:class B sortase [Oscillospiraceae bacterium]
MSMLNEARRGTLTDDRDRSFMGRVKELLPWKGDDTKEIVRKLVFLVAVVCLTYTVYDAIIFEFGSSSMHEDTDFLSDLYQQGGVLPDNTQNNTPVVNPEVTTDPDDNSEEDPSDVSSDNNDAADVAPISPYPEGMLTNFTALYDINPDIIGWLNIPGLADSKGDDYIDYPVVQTEDNDFYLDHDFFKNEKEYGALFADYHVKITKDSGPKNTIIYGHNMGAGTFFSHLHDYKKRASFVKEHNIITYSTLWEENDYIVIGCFLTGVKDEQDNQPMFRYHYCFDFKDMSDFDYWYKNLLYRNYYITDIDCTIEDEYITLSTCSTEFYDSRFVVIARKLREGEDPNQYTYVANPNVHKPAVFYEAYGMEVPKDNGPDYEYYVPEE